MEKANSKPQVTFQEAVKDGCSKFFDFNGRTRRSGFWWFILAFFICNLILSSIWKAIFSPYVTDVANLVVYFFALAITVRRLQDRNASKFWVIVSYLSMAVYTLYLNSSGIAETLSNINTNPQAVMKISTDPVLVASGLVMMVTGLVTFVICLLDSQPMPNKYGDSPKYTVS